MRDLNAHEIEELYDRGRCPFCLSTDFYEGPSGGMSTNWYCANEPCGAGFNLTPIRGFGCQLIRGPRAREQP